MTKLIGSTLVIEAEKPDVCEMCGDEDELRPYGPNGENICFDCGMQDEEAAMQQFAKRLGKANQVIKR